MYVCTYVVCVSKSRHIWEAGGTNKTCTHTHAVGTYTDCMDNFLVNIPIKGNLNNLADIDLGFLD